MKFLTSIFLLFVVGCATVPVSVPLPLPPELVIEKIQGSELMCLTDETYEALIKGIINPLKERNRTLRNIIESTHE